MAPENPQPFFRFYPHAYDNPEIFESSDAPCAHCRRPCVWRYRGGVHAALNYDAILCARCVSAGDLGKFFGGHYSFHDIEIDDVSSALAREVNERTPGVACFNPFEWPVIDGLPLAYCGTGEDPELLVKPEVAVAIDDAFSAIGWDDADGPSPYALIFKQVDGPLYQAVIDLD